MLPVDVQGDKIIRRVEIPQTAKETTGKRTTEEMTGQMNHGDHGDDGDEDHEND